MFLRLEIFARRADSQMGFGRGGFHRKVINVSSNNGPALRAELQDLLFTFSNSMNKTSGNFLFSIPSPIFASLEK